MTPDDLAFAPIAELAPRLRARELSPVEVTEAVLARIERLNPRLRAFITITGDEARTAAREAEAEIARGAYRGPLHGIPVSLKDLYATAGVRTTGGSRILAEHRPAEDATVTARLRAAGAILVGKTNMHEFAYGTTTINPHYGTVHNPWDLERITAGSSGGSAAAVAAGLSHASLGSETGFSIRRPAAFCGVVGLKPTYGRVSRHGMLPAAWSLDHAGPLTRSVADAALVLQAVAGADGRDPAASPRPVPDFCASLETPLAGLRVGVLRAHYAGAGDPAVGAAVDRVIDRLASQGVRVVDLSLPRVRYATVASSTIMYAEVTAVHARWLRERPADYGEDVRSRLELGWCVSAEDYLRAQRLRRWIAEEVAAALRQVDLLLGPTTPQVATPIAGGLAALHDPGFEVADGPYNLLRLFALIGLPAVAIPAGWSPAGLPVSVSFAGRPFDEATVLQAAHAVEQLLGVARRRPSLL